MSAGDAACDVPLGREIGVHRGASWRIETDSISGRTGKRLCETASRSQFPAQCLLGDDDAEFKILDRALSLLVMTGTSRELTISHSVVEGWASGQAASGAGGDLRRREPDRGGEDRRGEAPDRSRLGDEVQRPWAGRAD